MDIDVIEHGMRGPREKRGLKIDAQASGSGNWRRRIVPTGVSHKGSAPMPDDGSRWEEFSQHAIRPPTNPKHQDYGVLGIGEMS